jgi:lipopolysaccharide export system permease protein
MRILDKYILKKYLLTFSALIFMFFPLGIVVDLSQHIGKLIENDVGIGESAWFYVNFMTNLLSLLFPVMLFIAVLFFTSKLANNTEIVAMLGSGISYQRLLYPFLFGATIVTIIMTVLSIWIIPKANKVYNEFWYKYFKKYEKVQETTNIYRQINKGDFVFIRTITKDKKGYDFKLDHIENNELKVVLIANRIEWIPKANVFRLHGYKKRIINTDGTEQIVTRKKKDTLLNFSLDDVLPPVSYYAETLSYPDLIKFIEAEKMRGSPNIQQFIIQKHKRLSVLASVYILTIIAFTVAYRKRRGGMGVSLAIGLFIGFTYIFFDRIFSILGVKAGLDPFFAVWTPNIIFAFVAIIMLIRAKK